jgi:signal transduction histidine kinase
VLDLSKIEAGQFTLSLAEYALDELVQAVASVVEPLARKKRLAFTVEVAPGLPRGRGDERRLTQVLVAQRRQHRGSAKASVNATQ